MRCTAARTVRSRRRRARAAAAAFLVFGVAGCGSGGDGSVAAPSTARPAASATPGRTPDQGVDARGGLGAGAKRPATPTASGKPRSTPTASTAPRAACAAAPNTPGGADPWGGCWPGSGNTGVPAGTSLTKYTGSCDIRRDDVVIDGKIVDCGGMLVYGANLVIRRSKLVGIVKTNSDRASLRIEDSEVDGRDDQSEAIGMNNVTVLRSNVYGDQHSVHCGANCTVIDSWLHDQYDGKAAGWHQNAFITNGGSGHLLRHNSLHCRGGCTADVALIPDDDISDVTVDRNLLVASPDAAYCAYGGGHSGNKPGSTSSIVYSDNVFQRGAKGGCATYGPVTYFDTGAPGNRWIGNVWASGGSVAPEN